MENLSPLEKTWVSSFDSGNRSKILQSIFEIRKSGSIKILPAALALIKQNSDEEITTEILRLLSEIKSPEAVPVIAESLRSMDFGDNLNLVVASCWQSGLDFSKHFRVFAGVFIKADYKTALEAFTVIEESLVNASTDEVNDCLHYLNQSECMVSDEKLPLFRELKKVIEEFN